MGQYIDTILIKGEHVEHETHYHWIIFFSFKALLTLFLKPISARINSEFGITNKRVIIKTGFFARKTVEMNLSKIESVNVNQSISGRIFSYGDIDIVGTGGTIKTFRKIKDPITFRKKFQEMSID